MSKISRNDPCPCKSGEKYKKCCDKTKIWQNFREMGLEYFDERYALSDILESDLKFSEFYQNERRKISKPCFFVKGHNIGAAMSFGNIGDFAYIILSENSKIPKSDAIHVAHEIMHIVLCSERYQIVDHINGRQTSKIHRMINDMIYDPLLNSRLLDYGFDVKKYLDFTDERQKKTIGVNSQHTHDMFLMKTLYVKKTLDLRNLDPSIRPSDVEFNKWILKNYPDIIQECESLFGLVEGIGIGSPEQCERVLKETIVKFEMQDELFTKYL